MMEQAAAVLLLGGNAWKDLRKHRISILLTAGIFLAAVILRIRRGEYAALAAGILPGVILLGISWITKESLGYGDGLVQSVLGALLGWKKALEILLGAFFLAAIFSAAALAARRLGRKSELPFLPFILGAYLVLLIFE